MLSKNLASRPAKLCSHVYAISSSEQCHVFTHFEPTGKEVAIETFLSEKVLKFRSSLVLDEHLDLHRIADANGFRGTGGARVVQIGLEESFPCQIVKCHWQLLAFTLIEENKILVT